MEVAAVKRVLMLITEYGEGGAARVFAVHSQDLSPLFDVTECTFQAEPGPVYTTGRPSLALNVAGSTSLLLKAWNFVKRVARLRKIMHQGRFSMCISHMEGANYVNAFSLGNWRKVLVMHGSLVGDQGFRSIVGSLRSRLLIPLACMLADKVLVVSDAMKSELLSRRVPAHKIVSLPNYFQPDQIQTLAHQPIPPGLDTFFGENRVICHVARLSLQKNQKSLLKLFAALKPRGKYKLVFLGSGELLDELVGYARTLSLSVGTAQDPRADVLFLGYQPNPFAYLARSSLSILTSYHEGFPLALCESIYCKTPIASVDCPTGPRQILAAELDQTLPYVSDLGILLPSLEDRTDEKLFQQSAGIIHDFLEDQSRLQQVKERAFLRASHLYSRASVLPSFLELLSEIL